MNFLKAYKEKIEGAPNYDNDYVFYLVERFIKEYIPQVIEECINDENTKVVIAYRDIERFFKEIMISDVVQAVQNDKIKGVVISKTTTNELVLAEDENNVTLDVKKTNGISAESYVNKFSSYIPTALSFISSNLPFSSNGGHLETDLLSFINYYYGQKQCDDVLVPKTPEEEELRKHTVTVFKERILLDFIPTLIEAMKEKNKKKIVVQYSFECGVAKFGNLEISGIDLREFGKCLKMLPGKDVTDYASRSKDVRIENVYKYEFNLQDLEDLYKRTQQVMPVEDSKVTR